jgi:hypothetical protein
MAFVSVADRWTNRQKRTTEALVVTLDHLLDEGKGNREAPEYIKSWDGYTADVVEADTLITKVYCIVDECFPAGAALTVDIGGKAFFSSAAGLDSCTGNPIVSALEDVYFANGQTVTISVEISGAPQDITQGKLRLVIETIAPSQNNGNYANS